MEYNKHMQVINDVRKAGCGSDRATRRRGGAKAHTMAQGVSRRSTSVTFRASASPFQFINCDAARA